jgi:hypothetical protein
MEVTVLNLAGAPLLNALLQLLRKDQ